jgi:hypothetical protein
MAIAFFSGELAGELAGELLLASFPFFSVA